MAHGDLEGVLSLACEAGSCVRACSSKLCASDLVFALQRSDAILRQRLPRFRFVRQNRVLIFLARVVTPWASPIEPGLMFRIVV